MSTPTSVEVESVFSLSLMGKHADARAWTHQIGLQPTVVRFPGERATNNPRSLVMTDTYWELSVPRQMEQSVDAQVKRLLEVLHPKRQVIVSLKSSLDLVVAVTTFAWLDDDAVDLQVHLSNSALGQITELEASLKMVVYHGRR